MKIQNLNSRMNQSKRALNKSKKALKKETKIKLKQFKSKAKKGANLKNMLEIKKV